MARTLLNPFIETATEGSIVERLVLAVGLFGIVYALYEAATLTMSLVDSVEATEPLQPVITIFVASVVGLVALVLAASFDFGWSDPGGDGH